MMFAREGDLSQQLSEFERNLRDVFNSRLLLAELLPLDAANAKALVENQISTPGVWQETLEAIGTNRLQAVAGYPAALSYIARNRNTQTLTEKEVWRGVLATLLDDPRPWIRPQRTEPENRFNSTSRIAAAMMMAGIDELGDDSLSEMPTIDNIFAWPSRANAAATREGGRDALLTGAFHATPMGFRFLHRNVKEWFAAFGLADLPLAKLKPILSSTPSDQPYESTVRPEFSELCRLLQRVSISDEVRRWLDDAISTFPSDLFLSSQGEVAKLLDRLETLVQAGGYPEWINDSRVLNRLRVAGVFEDLMRRFSDRDRASQARVLALRIAVGLDYAPVLDMAATIVPDVDEAQELRFWCASSLWKSQRPAALSALVPFVEATIDHGLAEQEIASILVAALLHNRTWSPLRVYRWLADSEARAGLNSALRYSPIEVQDLSLDEALELLNTIEEHDVVTLNIAAELDSKDQRITKRITWRMYSSAVQMIAALSDPPDEQVRLLIPFALSLGVYCAHSESELTRSVGVALRASRACRREAFLKVAATPSRHDNSAGRHYWFRDLLQLEDMEWLAESIPSFAASSEAWPFSLQLAEGCDQPGIKRRIRSLVRVHDPDLLRRHDRLVRRFRQDQQKETERQQRKEMKELRLEDLNVRILADIASSPKERLNKLSWANFSGTSFRPTNVKGDWLNLSVRTKTAVIEECVRSLDRVEPTAIPSGQVYPMAVQFEAQAFVTLARMEESPLKLTKQRIAKWLPSVLRAFHENKSAFIEICHEIAPEACERHVLRRIGDELKEDGAYSVLLQDLPRSLWTPAVCEWVIRGVDGEQSLLARPMLLAFLARRRPEEALTKARQVLSTLSGQDRFCRDATTAVDSRFGTLGQQALQILLTMSPGEVLPDIQEGVDKWNPQLLEELSCLAEGPGLTLRAKLSEWQAEDLLRLARILFARYPVDTAEEESEEPMSRRHELARLKWRVLETLASTRSSEAHQAKLISPEALKAIEEFTARNEANALLGGRSIDEGSGIPLADACRLLDDGDFRVIRSSRDLLDVLLEELKEISKDFGHDYSLLYVRRNDGGRHRVPEETFQAYVCRRLKDRLPGKKLLRETQVGFGQRQDIRVTAPVIEVGPAAEVVIEVKWSDNPETTSGISTGLTEKLGKEYLLGDGLSEGIFLVGYVGKIGTWKRSAGRRPSNSSKALEDALSEQASEFCRAHRDLRIGVIVWDLVPKEI